VRLDATDAGIALQDAEQQLARTVRQTRTVFANRDQLAALVAQRRADLDRAQADFNRRKDLAAPGGVLGRGGARARCLKAARDALIAAQKSLAAAPPWSAAPPSPITRRAGALPWWSGVARPAAHRVRAPLTGYLARRGVQLGERIAPGVRS